MGYDRQYAVVADRDGSSRAIGRWLALLLFATLVGAATYLLAVHTIEGQTIENAALRGSDQIGADATLRADGILSQMTVGSLVIITVAIGLIGVLRGRVVLGVAGVAIVLGGQVITQVLKLVLPRPEFASSSGSPLHNSFPSGHSAIATSIVCALILVVPFGIRGVIGIAGIIAATAVNAYTVIAKWHRLSDTIGGNAAALTAASAVCVPLVAGGMMRMRIVDGGRHQLRTLAVVVLAAVAGLVTAVGVRVMWQAWQRPEIDYVAADRFLLGSQLLAGAATVIAVLLFWWTLYRLDVAPRLRRRDSPPH